MIAYHLPAPTRVRLTIYTSLGAGVVALVDQLQEAGLHTVKWDGCDRDGKQMPGGWYLYRLDLDTRRQMRRFFLVPERAPKGHN